VPLPARLVHSESKPRPAGEQVRSLSRRTKTLNIALPAPLKNCSQRDGQPMNGRLSKATTLRPAARVVTPGNTFTFERPSEVC